ncbi:MAG: prephenate dehydratase [Pseudomonadales bacterium]
MAGKKKDPLREVRARIDEIDQQMQRLLNERASCAQDVARIKLEQGEDAEPAFYRPEREAEILRAVMARNEGPLGDAEVARIFREIMSCCLSLEQPLTVAYLGPEGTFTEAAAIKHFGHFSHNRPHATIDEIFREVQSRGAHYGVVPVENSTEGMVNHTLDCFMASELKICGEVAIPIHHHLMVGAGTADDDLAVIYSHEQSLAQCRSWLDVHWPQVQRVAVGSNADAAQRAADAPGGAAIAGEMAADRYQLRIVASNIEDRPDNTTRFLVIGREQVGPSSSDKTSILVSTKNRPGALFQILEPFHLHGISLTRIETRPSRGGPWSYVFFIDFDGHQDSPEVKKVLEEVGERSIELRVLGSYPQSVL